MTYTSLSSRTQEYSLFPPTEAGRRTFLSFFTPQEVISFSTTNHDTQKKCILTLTEIALQICNNIRYSNHPLQGINNKRFKYAMNSPATRILFLLFPLNKQSISIETLPQKKFLTIKFFESITLFYKNIEPLYQLQDMDTLSTEEFLSFCIEEATPSWIFNMPLSLRNEEMIGAITSKSYRYLSLLVTESQTIAPIHSALFAAINERDKNALEILVQYCPLTQCSKEQAKNHAIILGLQEFAKYIEINVRYIPYLCPPEEQSSTRVISDDEDSYNEGSITTIPYGHSIEAENLESVANESDGLSIISLTQEGKRQRGNGLHV